MSKKRELVYCPLCGHTLTFREDGGRQRQACPNCGYVHYVNPVPGVGVLIEMAGGLVLIRRGHPPHEGEWALPSGFVEYDESAEDAAIRESEEETGLQVEIIELAAVNSFPEGPPISGIMIFYRVRPVGGELRAGDDAVEAKVFRPHELPELPFRTHREMVAQWLEARALTRHEDADPDRDFVIRNADTDDEAGILHLLRLIPANERLTEDDWRLIKLRLRESSGVEVFVAESIGENRQVIGVIALTIARTLTESRGFINDMAVLTDYQRRGVGAALLEAVLRRADRLGLRSLMVNIERANERAQAFYAATGFAESRIMHLKIRSRER